MGMMTHRAGWPGWGGHGMVGDTEPPVTLLQPAFREHGERCLFSYLDFLTQPWPLGGGCTLASGAGEPLSVKPRRSGAAQALGLATCRWDGRGGLVADLPPGLIHGSHSPAGAGAPRAPRRVGAPRHRTPLGVPVREQRPSWDPVWEEVGRKVPTDSCLVLVLEASGHFPARVLLSWVWA